jgi:hypothetical protein
MAQVDVVGHVLLMKCLLFDHLHHVRVTLHLRVYTLTKLVLVWHSLLPVEFVSEFVTVLRACFPPVLSPVHSKLIEVFYFCFLIRGQGSGYSAVSLGTKFSLGTNFSLGTKFRLGTMLDKEGSRSA